MQLARISDRKRQEAAAILRDRLNITPTNQPLAISLRLNEALFILDALEE